MHDAHRKKKKKLKKKKNRGLDKGVISKPTKIEGTSIINATATGNRLSQHNVIN
jgi:hypothetical protein